MKYQSPDGVQLVPHRLLPIYTRADPVEVLEFLTNGCKWQPSHLAVGIITMGPVRHLKDEEMLAMKEFLAEIVTLDLNCSSSVALTLLKVVIGDGSNCH